MVRTQSKRSVVGVTQLALFCEEPNHPASSAEELVEAYRQFEVELEAS